MIKIQLNWSKFHSIITIVCKWYQGEQGAALHEYGEQDGHEVDLHEDASHDNDSITTDNDSVDQEELLHIFLDVRNRNEYVLEHDDFEKSVALNR